jgi:hypothetical protein
VRPWQIVEEGMNDAVLGATFQQAIVIATSRRVGCVKSILAANQTLLGPWPNFALYKER